MKVEPTSHMLCFCLSTTEPWIHPSGTPKRSSETRNQSSHQHFSGLHGHSQSFRKLMKLRGLTIGLGIQYRLSERASSHQNFGFYRCKLPHPSFCQQPFLLHPWWLHVWDPLHFHIFQCNARQANSAVSLSIQGAMLPQAQDERTKWSFISARRSGWKGAITCVFVVQSLVSTKLLVQSSYFKKL